MVLAMNSSHDQRYPRKTTLIAPVFQVTKLYSVNIGEMESECCHLPPRLPGLLARTGKIKVSEWCLDGISLHTFSLVSVKFISHPMDWQHK